MHAARRTVRTAVERHEPRALILSTTTAAMLLPRLPVPYAVRFDSPARLNRPGARNAPLHALERRGMRGARITIPYSVAGAEALPADAARAIVVSPPIDASASHDAWNCRARASGRGVRARSEGEGPGRARAAGRRSRARRTARGLWDRTGVGALAPPANGVPEPPSARPEGAAAAVFRAGLRRARASWRARGGRTRAGAARGAGRRRAARHRSLGRPVRGAAPGARLDASLVADAIDRPRSLPRSARLRDAGRPRGAYRDRRPAAARIPPGGGAGR